MALGTRAKDFTYGGGKKNRTIKDGPRAQEPVRRIGKSTNDRGNPFKIGDKVVFDPDARAIGWTWSSFDRLRIHPGDVGIVTRLVDDIIYIDDGRGGFAWECFKKAK